MGTSSSSSSPSSEHVGTKTSVQAGAAPSAVRRFGRRMLLLIVLLGGSLAAAPWAASQVDSWRNAAIRAVLPSIDGDVFVGAASLSWWGPIDLRDVSVVDRQGEPLLEAARIVSRKSLVQLCLDTQHVGEFRCQSPRVRVVFREGGSSLEDVLAPVLSRDSVGESLEFSLVVEGGSAELVSTGDLQRGELREVELHVAGGSDGAIQVVGSAMTGDVASPGRLKFEIVPGGEAEEGSAAAHETALVFKAQRVDLALLDALLARIAPGVSLAGLADADVRLTGNFASSAARSEIAGRLTVQQLAIAAPGMAADERLQLPLAEINARGTLEEGAVRVQRLAWQSDISRGDLAGSIELDQKALDGASTERLRTLNSLDIRGAAEFDLALLAAALPKTLHLRDDADISRGALSIDLRTTNGQAGRAWQAECKLHALSAHVAGRPVVWDQPAELTLSAHAGESGPEVDSLTFQSKFLEATAEGSLASGRLRARCDLQTLSQQAGQFIDLAQARLDGRASVDAEWRWPANGRLQLDAHGTAEQLVVALPGRRPCRENKLDLNVSLAGEAGDRAGRLESATVQLTSGADKLLVALLEPVLLGQRESAAQFRLRVDGGLSSWLARVPFELLPATWNVAGTITAEGMFALQDPVVAWDKLRADFENLELTAPDWQASEPLVKLESSGGWDRRQGQVEIRSATLSSHVVAARAKDLLWRGASGAAPVAAGVVSYQADVGRLWSFVPAATRAEAGALSGLVKGRLSGTQAGDRLRLSAQLASDDLTLREPHATAGTPLGPLTANLAATYDRQRDELHIEKAQLDAQGLALAARGGVQECSERRLANLTGDVGYDFDRLSPLLNSVLPRDIRLSGTGQHPWQIHGPLAAPQDHPRVHPVSLESSRGAVPGAPYVSEELSAQAGLGWSAARAFGLAFGPAKLDARLAHGVATLAPFELAVGEGKLRLSAQVAINQQPMLVELPAGSVLEKVHLTPQICAGWLRYVAPLLADAALAEGRFSVDLAHGRLPVSNAAAGDIAGTLTIHSAQVLPGGVARQLVDVARQFEGILRRRAAESTRHELEPVLVLPDQEVEFALAQGRVEHRGLTMQSGDVTIRTHGSVGIDETLALVAELPIPADWVACDRYLKGMGGQTVQIPIGGTLGQPRVDSRALAMLAQKIAGSAAESAVEGVIQDQLKRLLPRAK